MAFDQTTRNRLAKFVGDARGLLTAEFTRQMQQTHGMDPATGQVAGMDRLIHLDDAGRETARLLRETMDHYLAVTPRSAKAVQDVLDRIVREQAFTVLNRLCALRMAEARGLLIESIAKGAQSKGFQPYARLAGTALGQTGDAYQCYLFSLFDEFALDLPVLFDRFSPQGRLFPRESALNNLLDLINHPELEQLWAEDETIGWTYQYFNSVEERKQMRAQSAAPRNSRELAVRNQFFTPRYVVEFLTDNTLGRIWYEMTRGETDLISECRYLVRRPREIFLEQPDPSFSVGRHPGIEAALQGDFSQLPEPDAVTWDDIQLFALGIDGYNLAPDLNLGDCPTFASQRISEFQETGQWRGDAAELWICLFYEQRLAQHSMEVPEGEHLAAIRSLYAALRHQLTMDTSELSQQELLNLPVFIPHRPRKDPRDILMLDPACGSMHFGLYAFDLYERIYEEAWQLGESPPSQATGRPLRADYPVLRKLLLDLPKLIIEHNIHGIDIDPRAVQIAGLSLWLRAQKSWKARNIQPQARPRITKSHIVCAEPMPGDETLRQEFIAGLTPRVLGQLVNEVFEKMKLAGEAGSLLKIEEVIKDAVAAAQKQAKDTPKEQLRILPGIKLPEKPKQLRFDLSDMSDSAFWQDAEQRILDELKKYAEQAENGNTVRRRLFAEDAARGFSFIDLCRKQYDVVLMNPPFGLLTINTELPFRNKWRSHANDVYVLFILRSSNLLQKRGLIGSITSRSFLLGRDQREFRPLILGRGNGTLKILLDLGLRVLDGAEVETCAYIIQQGRYDQSIFYDFRKENRKELDNLLSIISHLPPYIRNLNNFFAIDQTPIMYSADERAIESFSNNSCLDPDYARVTKGLSSCDDERFVFLAWEVNILDIGKRWKYCAKGSDYLWFVTNIHTVVDWWLDGDYIAQFVSQISPNVAQSKRSSSHYFKPGATYTYRCDDFSLRSLPKDCIFTNAAPVIIPKNEDSLPLLFAAFFSEEYQILLSHISKKGKYDTGRLKFLPVPQDINLDIIRKSWTELTAYLLILESGLENTLYFTSITKRTASFSYEVFRDKVSHFLNSAGRVTSEDFLRASKRLLSQRYEVISNNRIEAALAYYLGCLFARWDIRLALDSTLAPPLPDPFDPLPICPPGMLIGPDSLPATPGNIVSEEWLRRRRCVDGRWVVERAESDDWPLTTDSYPISIPWSGIIVDDENHPDDIIRRMRAVLDVIWGDKAGDIEQEACQILGVAGLREYFRKPSGFFADHLKRYSKSRRQAPIYWPLSTSSGDYTLWIYYHRLTDQTLYTCVNDFVEPRLKQIAERLDALRSMERRGAAEKEYEEQGRLELELREFRDELLRIAAFWKPNLNDGVQITASPLWRLFRLKPWQKKLKETWDKLEAGDYDWAHLAYSIWPDRVREVCKSDRSIAIAHGLEELCEVEAPKKGKKRGRKK